MIRKFKSLVCIGHCKKEPKIETSHTGEILSKTINALGFAHIGLDEPCRIIVGNNPVNWADPL